MKKKILALLTIILILVSISTAVFAGDPGGGISIPPPPIRDSITTPEGDPGGGISIPPPPIRDSIVDTE